MLINFDITALSSPSAKLLSKTTQFGILPIINLTVDATELSHNGYVLIKSLIPYVIDRLYIKISYLIICRGRDIYNSDINPTNISFNSFLCSMFIFVNPRF